jgi:uncharacterized protein
MRTLLLAGASVVASISIAGAAPNIQQLTKQCDAKKVASCELAAAAYQEGDGVEKDPAKVMVYLLKACTLNSGAGCNNIGVAWSEGKDGASDVDHVKARTFYEKACKLANGLGCFNLGNIYRLGEGVPSDLAKAATFFQKSCDLNEAKGCTELGIMYYEGKAVKKDVARAKTLLERACKLGSDAACKNVELLKKANQ